MGSTPGQTLAPGQKWRRGRSATRAGAPLRPPLIHGTPAIGGWIGDRAISTRHTMLTGALGFGYALM